MKENSLFDVLLHKTKTKVETLSSRLLTLERCTALGDKEHQMSAALSVMESAEQMTLLARSLPVYTGHPKADIAVWDILKREIVVEIGFTEECWFSLRMPLILPKKNSGSANYIRAFLYPAMQEFCDGKPPIRYRNAVLIYRHVYDRKRPERQMRDHDNFEINMVSDIVAMYVMPDDGPSVCSHYYCSAAANDERTEVYVVPKDDFQKWLTAEPMFPDVGVKLHENPL